jgi:hypothetical protein
MDTARFKIFNLSPTWYFKNIYCFKTIVILLQLRPYLLRFEKKTHFLITLGTFTIHHDFFILKDQFPIWKINIDF